MVNIKYKDNVVDTDHLNGRFPGAAHSSCKLSQHKSRKITFNFSPYDAHHIRTHKENIEEYPIYIISLGMQKYLRLTRQDPPLQG